jgi:HPt (histidine-containing phosphotransfer) domain-containing protein
MDEPVIDPAVYAALQDTVGAEFVADLADTFIEEATGMLAELRSARAANHPDRFRRAAHSLKTNSHTFGAMRLGALARDLELNGLGADPARDEAAIAALEVEYARAVAALKDLRNG